MSRWTESKDERWRERIGGYAQRLEDAAAAANAAGAHDAASHLRRASQSARDAESRLPKVGDDV